MMNLMMMKIYDHDDADHDDVDDDNDAADDDDNDDEMMMVMMRIMTRQPLRHSARDEFFETDFRVCFSRCDFS